MYNCYKRAYDNRNTSRDLTSSVAKADSHVQIAVGVETTIQLARENAFQNHLKVIDSVAVGTELQGYLKANNIEFEEKIDIL
ncbi:hypothetical protein A2U01_0081469, partial [Trifolium medium]|nr:hypothetical protein [Trifolium medium]